MLLGPTVGLTLGVGVGPPGVDEELVPFEQAPRARAAQTSPQSRVRAVIGRDNVGEPSTAGRRRQQLARVAAVQAKRYAERFTDVLPACS